MGKSRFRVLVDSGADKSLISLKMFERLPFRPTVHKVTPRLHTASGEQLSIVGQVELMFTMNGQPLEQRFLITDGLNRNFILGRDFLKKYGVRLYFDLGMMRVGRTYVQLEDDIHISAIIRLKKKTVLKPQTAVVCYGKINKGFRATDSGLLEVCNLESGCILDDPGLVVQDTVGIVKNTNKVPVLLVNYTNKHYKLKRGCAIGKGKSLQTHEVSEINTQNNLGIDKTQNSEEIDLSEVKADTKFKENVVKIIRKNKFLFAKKDSELGGTKTVEMHIDTGQHKPIKNRPYRVPLNKRKIIDDAVDEMLDAGVIERSMSPWSFPLVVVKKKDGSNRMCVDFRSLNKIIRPSSYPLPVIDDILALLGKSKYFTALDLKSGYWQIALEESSKEKTAFTCHKGLFQFRVMPFGLSTAPAVFQSLMSVVLQGCEDFAIAYLDDILIFSKNEQDHYKHIEIIFKKLKEHGLKLKLKKCAFFQEETDYLGFTISEKGVSPDQKKVSAIRELPEPKTVREVRGFIGMCSYYRRFIPNFSKIAEPIIALTKKYARFKWTPQCQVAFDYLKDSLTVVPFLAYPDTNKPYVLYTDASNTCIGACLTQRTDGNEEKPIYFLSHKLTPTQVKWSTIEKECFAIHYSLQKLDHYLHNAEFIIRTDHKPLQYILDAPMQNKKIQLWALSLSGYNCKVEYIKGTENHCADLLSRIPHAKAKSIDENEIDSEPDIDDRALEINVINSNKFNPKDFATCTVDFNADPIKEKGVLFDTFDMKVEQEKDDEVMQIKKRISRGTATKAEETHYFESADDGLLYYISNADAEDPRLRLYVPSHLERVVLRQYHDMMGHMGQDKTLDAIRPKYFFPNLYKKIHQYIEKCVTCQTRADKKTKPPVQEMETPPYPFAKIGLDLSGPYPTTLSGNKYIVSFIDLFSGWPESFPVPDKSADQIAHLILEFIVTRYGCPLEILTDNGSEQVNRKVKETLKTMNINHITTSYYSPQANGRVERFHRTLHHVMSKQIQDNLQTWDLYLNQTLAAIRFHVNESSKFSPFFLLYSRDVVLPLDTILKPRRRYVGEDQYQIALQQQHKSFMLVHKHMKEAKRKQKQYADKNSKEENFQVGDPVYLRNHRKANKLDSKWFPYFRIIEKTGPVTYVLRNQLDGTKVKTHERHIKAAHIEQWNIPQVEGRRLRNTAYVVPPDESNEESGDDENPQDMVVRHKRLERSDSEDEDDIPLMELRRRLHQRRLADEEEQALAITDVGMHSSDNDCARNLTDAAVFKNGVFLSDTEDGESLR